MKRLIQNFSLIEFYIDFYILNKIRLNFKKMEFYVKLILGMKEFRSQGS